MKTLFILINTSLIGLLISCNTDKVYTVSNKEASDTTKIEDEEKKKENDEVFTYTLVFEEKIGELYSYKLDITGEELKITYTFGDHDPIVENGKLLHDKKDGNLKIVVDGCNYCYKFVNTACDGCKPSWVLAVYNPETDGEDLHHFVEESSNCIVQDLF